MNVGIIGNNLTSVSLAKLLVNKKVYVTLFVKSKSSTRKTNRSIGITQDNLEFFNKSILKIDKKFINPINEIGIYFESNIKNETLNFKKNNVKLFNIIKVEKLYSLIKSQLKNKKYYKEKKITKKYGYDHIFKNKKYDLIVNCEKNYLVKRYFSQNHQKDYKSEAITCNLNHKKISNYKAVQIFTKFGPLAFLPLSDFETSVVFSIYKKKNNFSDKQIVEIINSYNKKYHIKTISNIERADLKFSSPRKYHLGNFLLFGDLLHKIHPLAGQGFNMTLRDLKILSNIVKKNLDLGLNLNEMTAEEFEKKVKHYNFIYANSINLLQDFFKIDSKYQNSFSNKILKFIGSNKLVNNFFTKVADQGININ